jgi:hypothetical protein
MSAASNYRCAMCGTKAIVPYPVTDKYGRMAEMDCHDAGCQRFGKTLVPYSEFITVTTQEYGSLVNFNNSGFLKSKEKDMCKEEKRWFTMIEPSGSGNGYFVTFRHTDKNNRDEFSRNFDTFELALEFVNKKYKELK